MATDRELFEAYQSSGDYQKIAADFGLNYHSVRGRVSRFRRQQVQRMPEGAPFPIRGQFRELPRYNRVPVIDTDVLVCGDVHLPTANWHMVKLFAKFAEKHMRKGHRVALIAGDLFNFNKASNHPARTQEPSLGEELAYGRELLAMWLKVFDAIIWTMGNHDLWFIQKVEGQLDAGDLGSMLSPHLGQRFQVFDVSQAWITQGGVSWRATHQRNYSRIRGSVASKIATKYQANIITHHEHHVAVTRDDTNRFTVVANGMLANDEHMHYVNVFDSTSPVMCSGFTFVRNGTAHLLTPYETLTDWDMWKMGAEALDAIEYARIQETRRMEPQPENVVTLPIGNSERRAA